MKKALIYLFLALTLSIFLPGCDNDSFALNAYKALKSSDITYTATMQAVAQAQAKGIISDEQRMIINEKAHAYVDAFRAAASALYTWELSRNFDDKGPVINGVAECAGAVKNLVSKAVQFGVKPGAEADENR